MRPHLTVLLWIAAAALLAIPATAADLEGRVVIAEGSRDEAGNVLVYFTPRDAPTVEAPAEPFEVVTVRKQFSPRTLAVPVGSTVRFPNQDNILHNVFSVSGKNRFDLGLYRRGGGKETTFLHPGVARIFCNVHHSMVAYVVVVETPHTTNAAADGSFRLTGLPAGPGTLTVWHERGQPWEMTVEAPARGIEARIELSKARVPRHLNKFGKPYSRKRSGRGYGD